MAREVEIKIKLETAEVRMLKKWLKNNAESKREVYQKEFYINNPKNSFYFRSREGFKDSANYLRVRFENKFKGSVCLKIFKKETMENIDEIEFNTDNPVESLKLLETLGYTDKSLLEKRRKIYSYKNYEIVLDDVTGLGFFAEFELKDDNGESDIKESWQKIRDFIKSIGFKKINEQHRGYVSMLWNPDRDFGVVRKL